MKRALLLTALLCVPFSSVAQDASDAEEPGFFGRLFGSSEAEDGDNGGFIERTIEDSLSAEGRVVEVTGFSGVLSGEARMEAMTFADDNGIWLRLEDVVLDWNRGALLRGSLDVTQLSAGLIELARTPLPSDTPDVPTPEAQGFSLPELPVSIQIEQIAADRVVLGEPLLGVPVEASVEGSFSLSGGEGAANLAIERLDADGALTLTASYANATDVLAIDLNLSEAAEGLLATLAGIPGQPALDFTVVGEDPLSDFTAAITLATDGAPRLEGTVSTLVPEPPAQFQVVADLGGDVAPIFAPDYRAFFGEDVQLGFTATTFPSGRVTVRGVQILAEALNLEGEVDIAETGVPQRIAFTGGVRSEGGGPVLLPLSGPETRVQDIDLTIAFDADVSENWTGQFRIRDLTRPGFSAERMVLDGMGRIVPGNAGGLPAVVAALTFEADALDLASAEAEQALGEAVTGGLDITWRSGDPIELSDLRINGESYALSGQTTITPGEELTIDGQLSVEAEDLSIFSGLAGRNLGGAIRADTRFDTAPLAGTFDVALNGQTENLIVDQPEADRVLDGLATLAVSATRSENGIRVQLSELASPNANLTGEADLRSEGSTASLSGSLSDVALVLPDISGPANIRANAAEDGGIWRWQTEAEVASARLVAEGTAISLLDTPIIAASGDASVGDLSEFATIAQRPDLAGSVSTRFSAEAVSDLSRISVDLDGSGSGIATGIPEVDRIIAGAVRFDIDATQAGNIISLQNTRIETATLTATADGVYAGDVSRLTASVDAADLSRLLEGAPAIPLVADLAVEPAETEGSLKVDLTATSPEVALNVAGVVSDPLGDASFDGEVDARAEDLSLFADLAGQPLAGAVSLSVAGQVAADLETLDLSARGQGQDVTTGIAELDRILAGALRFDVDGARDGDDVRLDALSVVTDALSLTGEGQLSEENSRARLTLNATDASRLLPDAPAVPLDLVAALDQVGADWDVDLDLSGPDLSAEVDGRVTDPYGAPGFDGRAVARAGDLSIFQGLANLPLRGAVEADLNGGLAFDLSRFDIDLTASGNGLAIGQDAADRLLAGDLSATVDASRDGEDITVRTLDLSTGLLSLTGDGTLSAAGSTLDLSARLADLGPFVPGFSGPVTANGTVGQLADGRFDVDLAATGPGGTTVNVDGTLASDFATADLGIDGNAPLALANSFIEPRVVQGTANFDMRLAGPLGLDALSGRVQTRDARFFAPTLNIALEQIALDTTINGGRARLDLSGALETGGQLSVAGPITLSGNFPAELAIRLDNAVLTDPSLYETTIDGTVTVIGPLAGGARIAGDLALGETNIRIPSTGLGGAGAIPEVTHLNEPPPVRATRRRAGLLESQQGSGSDGGGGAAYPLAIRINAPNQIFVRGRGLDSEFGGSLAIGGTSNNVIPTGAFNLIRGRLDILGQRLALEEATISMQGSFLPVIRIRAATQSDDFLISIIVSGPVSNPDIAFVSDPDLPEEEVVARLLFGRGIDQLSAIQAARLAVAVRTLAGRGGEGIVGNVRNRTGLADLDITTDDEGNAALRAGAYLSENIYTDVTVGTGGETELNLNLDLTRSLTAKGTVTTEGDTSIGIFFERDY